MRTIVNVNRYNDRGLDWDLHAPLFTFNGYVKRIINYRLIKVTKVICLSVLVIFGHLVISKVWCDEHEIRDDSFF